MKNGYMKTGLMGLLATLMVGVGCQAAGPRNPRELGAAYAEAWRAIPREDDIFERPLMQLAFPTETSISVWYLYPPKETERLQLNKFAIRKHGETNSILSGVTPVRSYIADTGQDETKLPRHDPKAERITFEGLVANSSYDVLFDGIPVLENARTKPLQTPDTMSFLAFSCNNPYSVQTSAVDGPNVRLHGELWHEHLSWNQNSLRLFGARANDSIRLANYGQPAFSLGLGDQVYVDGDNKLGNRVSIFSGTRSEPTFDANQPFHDMLDIVYRAHFAMPHFDRGLRGAPAALIWDDHEIQDGWGTKANELPAGYGRYFHDAQGAFLGYQSLRNPFPAKPSREGSESMDVKFDWGKQVRVLLLDTRSIKLPAKPGYDAKEYEAWDKQLLKVQTWLEDADDDATTLFVLGLASPLSIASQEKTLNPLLSLANAVTKPMESGDDFEDLWVSKAQARLALLKVLAEHFMLHSKHRLLIVSGDVHFSGINYLSTGKGSKWHVQRRADIRDRFQSTPICGIKENDPASEDVVWGWEVISSGISNDKYPDWFSERLMIHGTIFDGNEESKNPLVSAWPRGTIFGSPSFAEILLNRVKDAVPKEASVDPNAPMKNERFEVRAVFYPSVYKTDTRDRGRSINSAAILERNDPWQIQDYDYDHGDRTDCSKACPDEERVSAIPLDWMCIPRSPTTKTSRFPTNCMHACSDILKKRGEPQWAAKSEKGLLLAAPP